MFTTADPWKMPDEVCVVAGKIMVYNTGQSSVAYGWKWTSTFLLEHSWSVQRICFVRHLSNLCVHTALTLALSLIECEPWQLLCFLLLLVRLNKNKWIFILFVVPAMNHVSARVVAYFLICLFTRVFNKKEKGEANKSCNVFLLSCNPRFTRTPRDFFQWT